MSKPGPPFWCVRSTNSKAPIFLGASGCRRGSGQALGELATYQLPLQSFHLFSAQQDPKDVLSHSVQIPAGGRRDRDERCHLSGGACGLLTECILTAWRERGSGVEIINSPCARLSLARSELQEVQTGNKSHCFPGRTVSCTAIVLGAEQIT